MRRLLWFVMGFAAALFIASSIQAQAAAPCVTVTAAPTQASTMQPTDVSTPDTTAADYGSQDNPIPFNTRDQIKFTGDTDTFVYAFTVQKVTIGAKAVAAVKAANQFNDSPPPGYTYMVAYILGEYVSGPKGKTDSFGSVDVQALSNGTLSSSVQSSILIPPAPAFNFKGYPGGKFKGWVVLAVDATDTNPLIAIGIGSDGTGGVFFATK
jgi:hypothetical protein